MKAVKRHAKCPTCGKQYVLWTDAARKDIADVKYLPMPCIGCSKGVW